MNMFIITLLSMILVNIGVESSGCLPTDVCMASTIGGEQISSKYVCDGNTKKMNMYSGLTCAGKETASTEINVTVAAAIILCSGCKDYIHLKKIYRFDLTTYDDCSKKTEVGYEDTLWPNGCDSGFSGVASISNKYQCSGKTVSHYVYTKNAACTGQHDAFESIVVGECMEVDDNYFTNQRIFITEVAKCDAYRMCGVWIISVALLILQLIR
eukprot:324425_1